MKSHTNNLFLAACASFLTACATGGINTSSPSFWPNFALGNVRLTCGLPCSGTSGANLQKEYRLFQNRLWRDLATEVSKVGFENDREYFFLGAAAESLGYRDAAKIYYKLSTTTTYKCSGNLCVGLVLPRDAIQRINFITAQEDSERRARSATPKGASTSSSNSVNTPSNNSKSTHNAQAVPMPQLSAPPPTPSPSPDTSIQQSAPKDKKNVKSDNSI